MIIKNYYFSLELNLENEHVKKQLEEKLTGLITADALDVSVNSRFFTDTHACFSALHDDMNLKAKILNVAELPIPVTSVNETNPLFTNSPELIEEFKKKHPEFSAYLASWGQDELMRLTFTTEEFEPDDDALPLFTDEKALMFRYVMHQLDDDLAVPDGKYVFENISTMLH